MKMRYLSSAMIAVMFLANPAEAAQPKVVKPRKPFFDMNNNQVYDSGDKLINFSKLDPSLAPFVTMQKERKHPTDYHYIKINGPAGAGLVVPKGSAIKAHQLEIVVDGDIILNAGINTHYLDGNRIQLYGNIMGTLRLQSQNGRIVMGPEVKLKPDMISMIAYGDIVLEQEARVFQFAKGFAQPLLRTRRTDYTDANGNSLPLELAPQVIMSLNGNIILKRQAEIDLNDRLDVIAANGIISLDSSSYLRARNKMLVQGKLGVVALGTARIVSGEVTLAAIADDLSDMSVRNAIFSGVLSPTRTGVVSERSVQGTRAGNQCKTGNGVVPECVQSPPVAHIIDIRRTLFNQPLPGIDK